MSQERKEQLENLIKTLQRELNGINREESDKILREYVGKFFAVDDTMSSGVKDGYITWTNYIYVTRMTSAGNLMGVWFYFSSGS
jgi:hypothetical protein